MPSHAGIPAAQRRRRRIAIVGFLTFGLVFCLCQSLRLHNNLVVSQITKKKKNTTPSRHSLLLANDNNSSNESRRPKRVTTTTSRNNENNGQGSQSTSQNEVVILYSVANPSDRSGALLEDMILCHAYAFAHNYTYGGACARDGPVQHQATAEQLIQDMATMMLLPKDADASSSSSSFLTSILKFACPPNATQETTSLQQPPPPPKAPTYKLLTNRQDSYWRRNVELVTPAWRNRFAVPLVTYSSAAADTVKVVMHVRRGDVTPCRQARYLPNAHYQRVLQRYVFLMNNNDNMAYHIVIHSETESPYEPWNVTEWQHWADHQPPPSVHVTLRLDAPLQETWRDLWTADVLIPSRSAFSWVPAVLGQHQRVICTPYYWCTPNVTLNGWTVADD